MDTHNHIDFKLPAKWKIVASSLEKEISESSGLIYFDNALWTINDGGNPPILYKMDNTTGKIQRRVFVSNANNIDWEALTQDDSSVYIGDFGNNSANRRDLKILKINKKDLEKDTVQASFIQFSYSFQNNFDLISNKHNFDCEAFCSIGDSLFLFSKNWSNRKTYIYALQKFPGMYSISPLDTFNAEGLITDADYNEVDRTLVLMGYNINKVSVNSFIWVIRDFTQIGFLSENNKKISLHLFIKQNEAITHSKDGIYYFTTEFFKRSFFRSQSRLYLLKLKYQ